LAKIIVIIGARGFIGRCLCRHLADAGYEILALSRGPAAGRKAIDERALLVKWDGKDIAQLQDYLQDAFGIINLAGENIGARRWTAKSKHAILQSRLTVTDAISRAIEILPQKLPLVIQASATGYYGDCGDELLTEDSPAGKNYLAEVCQKWERAIQPVNDKASRLVIIRLAAVLGKGGGIISKLTPVFRYYLGGRFGSGNNWFSWIHIDDVCRVIIYLLENEQAKGTFNLCAPNPVESREFTFLLAQVLHRPAWFAIPAWALKLLRGQMAKELILSSQKVIPDKLRNLGYQFLYPDMHLALQEILGQNQSTVFGGRILQNENHRRVKHV